MKLKNLKRKLKDQQGFTIMELIIVTIIVVLLTTAFLPFFKINVKSYTRVRAGKDIVQGTRVCMSKMTAQISRLLNVSDIRTASSTRFRFWDPDGNDIDYELDGDELENAGLMILDNLTDLTFTYYDNEGNTTTTINDIWRIQMSISVDAEDIGSMTFVTQVFPKNFGF